MKGFLYGQTEYNMLENTNRLDDYISMAIANSFDFLTITDTNLYGNYKFYKKCIKENIKPIIGLEFSYKTEDQNYSKVIFYAKNNNGYKNLLKISSEAQINGLDDLDKALEFTDDLFTIFIFNDSFLERLLYSKEYSILDEYLNKIKNINDSYIGVSFTNKLNKLDLNMEMVKYSTNFNINCVPVHQCKYLANKDVVIYEALSLIGGKEVNVLEYEDYSFEVNPLQNDNIDYIISNINLNLFNEKIELPKYPNTKGVSSKEYLGALCHKGLEKRNKCYNNYLDRLNYELNVIDKMGYNDYFLIVWDFIKYAKQNKILVGPGRGSAAGSLVSYVLGITEVDPIEYDLLFERFLNPERISMPDIDTDFPDVSRDLVIEHVKQLYGDKHVCNISAYGTFLIKSSIRDLARVKRIDNSRVEKIIEMVEKYGFDKLLEEYKNSELYDFLYIAKGLEGLPRHISTHAAGIILSALPLDEIIPLQEGINGLYQSQLEASDLEKIGLLKMDFLGIRNLTMIDGMMSEIPNFSMNSLRSIPLDDPKTFKLLQAADTLGIFQLESTGIRNVLSKLKPTCFEDLVAVLALYRPGPMDNIDEYIARKHGKKFDYIHPSLEPILKSTYGIIIYQEQIMKIASVFAGYSLGEADVLRRAVSKKDAATLKELEVDFINKSISKGYDKDIAKNIYDLIYKFANYGFNRSHSVAYAILSYQMSYFKANYFQVFMANILNNVIGNTSTLVQYIKYAKHRGLTTLKPNINISTNKFVSTKHGLFMPLNSIFSIGDVVTSQIIEERNNNGLYTSFDNFKERCSFISSSCLEALIYSGALDIFGQTKKSMLNISTKEDELFLKFIKDKTIDSSEIDLEELKALEFKYLGINLEYSLFKDIEKKSIKYKTIPIQNVKYNMEARLLVAVSDFKQITTKNKDKMLVGTLEDQNSSKKFTIFPKIYNSLDFKIDKNTLYLVLAKLEKDNKNEDCFTIFKIAPVK